MSDSIPNPVWTTCKDAAGIAGDLLSLSLPDSVPKFYAYIGQCIYAKSIYRPFWLSTKDCLAACNSQFGTRNRCQIT